MGHIHPYPQDMAPVSDFRMANTLSLAAQWHHCNRERIDLGKAKVKRTRWEVSEKTQVLMHVTM